MAPRAMAGQGTSPGQRLPGLWGLVSLLRGRPWGTGARPGSRLPWSRPRGPRGPGSAARDRHTASSACGTMALSIPTPAVKRCAARPQQRVGDHRDHALEAAQKRVAQQGQEVKTPQARVVESASTGHGTRLEQRPRPLAVLEKAHQDAPHKHDRLAAPAAAWGPPGPRADRAFRTQTIMTVRTLL